MNEFGNEEVGDESDGPVGGVGDAKCQTGGCGYWLKKVEGGIGRRYGFMDKGSVTSYAKTSTRLTNHICLSLI